MASSITPVTPIGAASSVAAVLPKRKVRVLFVNDTARNGGPGQSLYTILRFLDTEVVHRSVVLPREGVIAERFRAGGVVDDLQFLPNLVENPFEPWDRPIERTDFEASKPTKAVRLAGNVGRGAFGLYQLSSIARRGLYDLVYCNGTTANFAGGGVASFTGIPALWHARYTSIAPAIKPLHDRLAKSRGVRRVVCVSHASAKVFAECPEKVRVINNAVDTDDFAPNPEHAARLRKELGKDADTVVFGSHGRVLRPKGYIEMIQAAHAALGRMTPDERKRTHFVIVGDTPADFRVDHLGECRALVHELGIQDHFSLLGFRKDIRDVVDGFDVAVVPSIYPDPLPRSVLESMAVGKPVIAFDVGGVSEMLQNGTSGTLLPLEPPYVDALAEQFLRYLRDADLRIREGKAARARIEAHFSGRAHARRIQNEIVEAAGLAT